MTYILKGDKQNQVSSAGVRILFTLDLLGNVKSIDALGEKILGYGHHELRQMNLGQLVAPEFVEFVRQQIARAVTAGPGAVYEIEIIAKDRRKVSLEISTRLVMGDDHRFELEGIALVRNQLTPRRPRCLDEQFTLVSGLRPCRTLTFSSSGNKPLDNSRR